MSTYEVPGPEDIRHRFGETLEGLKLGAVKLGSLVQENCRRSSAAMLENRLDLADEVADHDVEIDHLYADLERGVFEVLARQQPVAGDLRFLVAMTRILYELERSGDLAVNCMKELRRSDGFDLSPALHGVLSKMCAESCAIFGRGLDALADMDGSAGPRLDAEDDVVDDLVSDYYTALSRESDNLGLDLAMALSRVGRYMERIADHAVNIGDHVTYIVTGEWIDSDEA